MAKCHHCGENLVDEPRWGPCSICGTNEDFCTLCGWWELGPEDWLDKDRWREINARISAKKVSLFESCEKLPDAEGLVAAIVCQCELMQAQLEKPSLFQNQDYTYRLWREAHPTWFDAAKFVCGFFNHLFGTTTTAKDYDTRPAHEDCRLHGMLLTFLSAYQACAEAQQARLIADAKGPPLNIHDAAKLAELHYLSHGGFGKIDEILALHDSLTLRHLGTMEQLLKGNLDLQMAHALITSDTQSERLSRQIAIHAFMLYSALLPVFQPYESQTVPSKGTFNASSNLAAGIFTKADLDRLFYQWEGPETAMVKMAPQSLLHRLVVSFETSPLDPDYRRWFKRHSAGTLTSILEHPKLTDLQKIYLLSFPSLDDPKCPSACRLVQLKKTTKAMAGFFGRLFRHEELTTKLKQAKLPLPFDGLDPLNLPQVQSAVEALLGLFHQGRYPLQTCCTAANIGYIGKGPYKGLLEVYEEPVTLADVLAPCSVKPASASFPGLRYRLTDVMGAADQRTKSPFQYLSWRVQKDRMAHRFLPMEYREYEVTAAISQAFPVPMPDPTYGDHLILWKPDLLTRCTFKVGDSGKPTRSFLVLLQELLDQIGRSEVVPKTALFNLLLLFTLGQSRQETFQELTRAKELLVVFPSAPPRLLDLEAHLYGTVGIGDAELILAPCPGAANAIAQQSLLERAQKAFNTERVLLYDQEALAGNKNKDLEWFEPLAKL